METARDVLVALVQRYAFGEVAALVAGGAAPLPDEARGRLSLLCTFGQRLLDLDAEDFDDQALARVDPELVRRARAARMPQEPREEPRGALGSLVPAYRLMLEVIAARWVRREMSAIVAAVHISSEYLPLLIWERVLGHAGDPALLTAAVGGPGSKFGAIGDRSCPHNSGVKSAASRALRVINEPVPGWRAYLDRQHSNMAQGLAVCAGDCPHPCTVIGRLSEADRGWLTERCEVALAFCDSALIRLRHAAPVGHGFGVPAPDEVTETWQRTRASIDRFPVGRSVLTEDGFPLPGLPSLFSALTGEPLSPDTLLADVATRCVASLTSPAAQVKSR